MGLETSVLMAEVARINGSEEVPWKKFHLKFL